MPSLDRKRLRGFLERFDLRSLFIEELGWDRGGEDIEVAAAARTFSLKAIAHKRGMVAYQHVAAAADAFPDYPTRQKIEKTVAKTVHEHIIIYALPGGEAQYWQWVKRETGRPDRSRQHIYHRGQPGEALIQRLEHLAFTLEEEEDLSIIDVSGRVRAAFDVEKVTKRFYERFKAEHKSFLKFINGIKSLADREWYASLMLNRMMFVYFIQKRGFLDGDPDYLRNRLNLLQKRHGKDKFQRFYRLFLLRLFHEGLGQPAADRAPELAELLGRVPYLNGGLFDVHDLERQNPGIEIPDEAFERIFAFFDAYNWHLDDRPLHKDDEINPDVLGYIFEKYVNQKQMGAYYSKEDITGYISRNTIVPFLFEEAKKACPIAFNPGGGVWRLLQDDPDRYFYDAVRQGITYDIHAKRDLDKKRELPAEIAAGRLDVAQRKGWNGPASNEYALPTETWREHCARRQHYEDTRKKLAAGEVTSIADLVTLNLDVEKFVQDVIAQSEGPELVRAFWKAITKIAVLDPTCGSGAFLFAALNILEPIYLACLQAMRGFLDDLDRSPRKHHVETMSDFRAALDSIGLHASERYFILKQIIISNLYGVDIMEEAVEICKLRLFLKLVAQLDKYDQIEPLPDIDFNIRPGNTLVGFTSIDEVRHALSTDIVKQLALPEIEKRAELSDRAFRMFREMQTKSGMTAHKYSEAKKELRRQLDELRNQLDGYQGEEYGIKGGNKTAFMKWRSSHQPFHWFVEFYGIMRRGGFDVIVGNPPYVEHRKVTAYVLLPGRFEAAQAGNLYADCMERASKLVGVNGKLGMIVPVGLMGLDDSLPLRQVLSRQFNQLHFSSYAIRPSKLFDGVDQRLCIVIGSATGNGQICFSTRYHHWNTEERAHLFSLLNYVPTALHERLHRIPQLGSTEAHTVLDKIERKGNQPIAGYFAARAGGFLMHYHRSPRYWIRAMDFEQYFRSATRTRSIHHFRDLRFDNEGIGKAVGAILNSTLFFFWFLVIGNGRNITGVDVETFPVGAPDPELQRDLGVLFDELMIDYKDHSVIRTRQDCEYQEFRPSLSKQILDNIDRRTARHYDFSDFETDFLINFEIKYRMGAGEPEMDEEL